MMTWLAGLVDVPGDVFDEQVDFPGQVFRVGQVVTDRRRPFRAEGSDVDGQLRASPRLAPWEIPSSILTIFPS